MTDLQGIIPTKSCEVLILDGDHARWESLPHMHRARTGFACASVGGCVIVAGGVRSCSGFTGPVEVYEEAFLTTPGFAGWAAR